MADGVRALARGWRPATISLRARLTLIYGCMFLVAGVLLLGLTYALFSQRLESSEPGLTTSYETNGHDTKTNDRNAAGNPGGGPERLPEQSRIISSDGTRLSSDDAAQLLQNVRDSATSSLLTQGGVALLVVGGFAAGFGWLVAGRVLAPLRRVTETAGRIAAAPDADRGLHERIALSGPDDEVKELADTFDTMVARLDRSFDGQRRFVANASHELRTPLTVSRGLIEVAISRTNASDETKQLGEDLLRINARHEDLISGLMLLASSASALTARYPVDLADVVDHVVTQTAAEAERAGVTIRTDTAEAMTDGDALLLDRLVHNLVENGIRHNTGAGGWVRVVTRPSVTRPSAGLATGHDLEHRVRAVTEASAPLEAEPGSGPGGRPETGRRTVPGEVALEVSNSGPSIPSYEIESLFEPFRRYGTDRLITAKGAGLGLSIVRAIARAHDGEVTAHAGADGGLVVTVTLPVSGADGPGADVDSDGSDRNNPGTG